MMCFVNTGIHFVECGMVQCKEGCEGSRGKESGERERKREEEREKKREREETS